MFINIHSETNIFRVTTVTHVGGTPTAIYSLAFIPNTDAAEIIEDRLAVLVNNFAVDRHVIFVSNDPSFVSELPRNVVVSSDFLHEVITRHYGPRIAAEFTNPGLYGGAHPKKTWVSKPKAQTKFSSATEYSQPIYEGQVAAVSASLAEVKCEGDSVIEHPNLGKLGARCPVCNVTLKKRGKEYVHPAHLNEMYLGGGKAALPDRLKSEGISVIRSCVVGPDEFAYVSPTDSAFDKLEVKAPPTNPPTPTAPPPSNPDIPILHPSPTRKCSRPPPILVTDNDIYVSEGQFHRRYDPASYPSLDGINPAPFFNYSIDCDGLDANLRYHVASCVLKCRRLPYIEELLKPRVLKRRSLVRTSPRILKATRKSLKHIPRPVVVSDKVPMYFGGIYHVIRCMNEPGDFAVLHEDVPFAFTNLLVTPPAEQHKFPHDGSWSSNSIMPPFLSMYFPSFYPYRTLDPAANEMLRPQNERDFWWPGWWEEPSDAALPIVVDEEGDKLKNVHVLDGHRLPADLRRELLRTVEEKHDIRVTKTSTWLDPYLFRLPIQLSPQPKIASDIIHYLGDRRPLSASQIDEAKQDHYVEVVTAQRTHLAIPSLLYAAVHPALWLLKLATHPYTQAEFRFRYVPHLVTLALSEIERKADLVDVEEVVRTKILRTASFPAYDLTYLEYVKGTMKVAKIIHEMQDFQFVQYTAKHPFLL